MTPTAQVNSPLHARRGGRVRRRRPDPFERPLDRALLALRQAGFPYRWSEDDLRAWESPCPACCWPGWGLRIREQGAPGASIAFHCSSGCPDADIRAALDAAAHEIDPYTLELVEQARDVAARALALATEQIKGEAPELELGLAA
jgi:hypothetical protein